MAISDLKLPEGVSSHTFKNPALLAEGLATKVAGQLNQAIAEQGVATLVVSGGRSPVAGLVMGAVATRVLHVAPCPVLLVK